jgi:hypothetical protein
MQQNLDKTLELAGQQIRAMGAAVFEVGLFKPDDQRKDNEPAMIPRVWDAETLMRSVPWMKFHNSQGRNIYVRPKGEHDLSLVDDLKAEAVKRMNASGFKPAVLVETSAGNFQAWLKHPRVLSKEVSTAAARALAEQFGGDKGAADWRHFGRLAGFTNRKLKYQSAEGLFPFVRLVAAPGCTYQAAGKFLERIEAQLQENAQRRVRQPLVSGRPAKQQSLKNIEDFRANPAYGGDGSRIDLAFAIYALSHGIAEAQVEASLLSRDLSHKGDERRQADYVDRTVKKAFALSQRAVSR